MVVTLRCLTQAVDDLVVHIKLVKGERRNGGWVFDGCASPSLLT